MMEIDPKAVKDELIENAFNFLNQSIAEFEIKLQFSIIHFYTSIELFIKAKLLDEHWSLIFEKPEEATIEKFSSGDFKSVSLEAANKRLQNILHSGLSAEESKCFNKIRNHRNKAVHFFHNFHKPDLQVLKEEIISLQCEGWAYINDLLSKRWVSTFTGFDQKISDSNRLMHDQRKYLARKFELKKTEIAALVTAGRQIEDCPFCGFRSCLFMKILGPLFQSSCLVCEKRSSIIKAACPNCEGNIYSRELGEGCCLKCSEKIDLAYLKEQFDEDTSSNSDIAEGEYENASCTFCEYYEDESVIKVEDQYLCLACHETYSEISNCNSCGERLAGNDDSSFGRGCFKCNL